MTREAQVHDRALDVGADDLPDPPADEVGPVEDVPSRPSFVLRLFSIFVPVLVCLGGVAAAAVLVATRPEAERTDPETRGVPVRVMAAQATTAPIRVRAQGQVRAAREVRLQPEVAGRVVWVSDELVPGGLVSEGARLVRVDPRDYQAALEQQRAQLANAEVAVTQENSRRVIAQREWALLGNRSGGTTTEGRDLALREPQLRQTEAQLRAARASVQQASTNLRRTTLSAPFDAMVQAESVDVGQLVTQAAQLATLVGTDQFWVQVAIPMEELAWIDVPRGGDGEGSPATVTQIVGEDGAIVREGRVVRLMGDLDPVGRMARVLVAIDDPLGLRRETEAAHGDPSALPMLIGAFVRVEIDAGRIEGVTEIPRGALHAGDVVYVAGEDDRLAFVEVDVVWRREDTVLVRGLAEGAQVVTSQVSPAVEGTLLRRMDDEAGSAGASATGASAP